jgi:Plasmid recombination enzyme
MAARHNLRDHQAEHGALPNISLELSHTNIVLHGPSSPAEIVRTANDLKAKYSVPKRKLRLDHVQALEFVISVRFDSDIDEMAYFRASVRWLEVVFSKEMLLSAVVHYDEAEPHMHVLVLPIVNGQYMGGEPIDKTRLPKLTKRFAAEVGKAFGFSFERKLKLHATQRAAAANLIIDHLVERSDPLIDSSVWAVVAKHIQHAPQEYLQALGLGLPDTPRKKLKTMAEIFTGTGKKTDEDRNLQIDQDLTCVGQQNFSAPFVPGVIE